MQSFHHPSVCSGSPHPFSWPSCRVSTATQRCVTMAMQRHVGSTRPPVKQPSRPLNQRDCLRALTHTWDWHTLRSAPWEGHQSHTYTHAPILSLSPTHTHTGGHRTTFTCSNMCTHRYRCSGDTRTCKLDTQQLPNRFLKITCTLSQVYFNDPDLD